MLKRSIVGAGFAAALVTFAAFAGACGSSGPLPPPKSDSQFDDPDDPQPPGTIGAVNATTGTDASIDASNACNGDGDCKGGKRCFFPLSDACEAQGQCLDFQDTPDCPITRRCTCAGARLEACAPPGYATMPVEMTCFDAGSDSAPE